MSDEEINIFDIQNIKEITMTPELRKRVERSQCQMTRANFIILIKRAYKPNGMVAFQIDSLKKAREEERERITDLMRRAKQNKIRTCLCCKTQEYFRVPRTWKVVRPIMKLYGAKAFNDYICFRCFFDFEKIKSGKGGNHIQSEESNEVICEETSTPDCNEGAKSGGTVPNKRPTPKWAIQILERMDGRIEYVCKHGVGHPIYEKCSRAVHGCDGCCMKKVKKR